MTRITQSTIKESTLAHLQGNLAAIARTQEQLSSGSRINRPSDDPSGTVSALELRQQLRANDQYARNTADGQTWLNTVDRALQTSVSQLNIVKDRAIQANNAVSSSPESRAAIAAELEGVRATLVSLANTKVLGRNVFAGTSGASTALSTTTTTDPVTGATSNTYTWAATGTGSTVDRRIDATSTVRVDSDGAAVFGQDAPASGSSPATTSVFTDLDTLIRQVRSGADTSAAVTALQGHLSSIKIEGASVGARMNRLTGAADATASSKVDLTEALSGVADADMPSTIVNLQMQQAAYQAALGATAKVLQPSLMQFLS